MTNSKQNQKKNKSIIAAIAGAIVGAGAAIAGTAAFKDKKNRDKAKKVLTNIKNQALGYVKKMQKETKSEKINKKKV
jgi:gas vesicle protein